MTKGESVAEPKDDELDERDTSEVDKLRSRLHRLADRMQSHESRIIIVEYVNKRLEERMDVIGKTMATGEQLAGAVEKIELKLTNARNQLEDAVCALKDDLAPIKKGIYWVITIVLGAVILAGLGLVLAKPGVRLP